jgi:hypothetical protein
MFLLLNLNTREYTLNLNKENIDTSLKIIESLAKLHSEFWNKPIKQTFTFLHLFTFQMPTLSVGIYSEAVNIIR